MDQKIVFGMGVVVLTALIVIWQLPIIQTEPEPLVSDTVPEASPLVETVSTVPAAPDFDEYVLLDTEYYEGETKSFTPKGILSEFGAAIASATPPLANFAGQYAISEWHTAPDRVAGVVFNARTAEPVAVVEGSALNYHFDSRLLVVHTPLEDLFFIIDAGLEYLGSQPTAGAYAAVPSCGTDAKVVTTASFGVLSYYSYCPGAPHEPLNPATDVAS